ncbi:hypothetical protein MATL_G00125870 [Megalops atlanticus]|uniref:Uncharacterized protein n=1 Tax=Megalops atlanticus TaxID=7932 RepID=A0A9D3PZ83_MEGAT|nr:hypothetical protein MATL_G00125870 [Megalops atlanticus]
MFKLIPGFPKRKSIPLLKDQTNGRMRVIIPCSAEAFHSAWLGYAEFFLTSDVMFSEGAEPHSTYLKDAGRYYSPGVRELPGCLIAEHLFRLLKLLHRTNNFVGCFAPQSVSR